MATADYDEIVLQEIKQTNIQRLDLVRKLKTSLEQNIRAIDSLQRVRRETASFEAQIERKRNDNEKLEALLNENGVKK